MHNFQRLGIAFLFLFDCPNNFFFSIQIIKKYEFNVKIEVCSRFLAIKYNDNGRCFDIWDRDTIVKLLIAFPLL